MSRIVESLYDRYIINESYKLIPGKTYRIKGSHNRLAEFEYVGYDENGYKFKPLNAIAKKFAKESVEANSEYLGYDGFFEYNGFLYLDDYDLEVYFDKYKINESHKINESGYAGNVLNVTEFIETYVGSLQKFKIETEDEDFACSGNMSDGEITNIIRSEIDTYDIPDLKVVGFTVDEDELVLYCDISYDLFLDYEEDDEE